EVATLDNHCDGAIRQDAKPRIVSTAGASHEPSCRPRPCDVDLVAHFPSVGHRNLRSSMRWPPHHGEARAGVAGGLARPPPLGLQTTTPCSASATSISGCPITDPNQLIPRSKQGQAARIDQRCRPSNRSSLTGCLGRSAGEREPFSSSLRKTLNSPLVTGAPL